MSNKVTTMGPSGPEKMKGWHSWRHQTADAQTAAREAYQTAHGRKARQRRAKERAALWAEMTVAERQAQMQANREAAESAS